MTAAVPLRSLYTGAQMPAIGLGTFGSDHADPIEVACAVRGAYEVGYRHFDCASIYGNEREIGLAFCELLARGAKREELWVTSKLWNDMHSRVEEACRQSLAGLQLNYLDLYLVHWPVPTRIHPGARRKRATRMPIRTCTKSL